jgi:hypothetical protein
MVAGRFIQMGSVSSWDRNWSLLARFFYRLSSLSNNFCRDQFSVRHIRMGEAINGGKLNCLEPHPTAPLAFPMIENIIPMPPTLSITTSNSAALLLMIR